MNQQQQTGLPVAPASAAAAAPLAAPASHQQPAVHQQHHQQQPQQSQPLVVPVNSSSIPPMAANPTGFSTSAATLATTTVQDSSVASSFAPPLAPSDAVVAGHALSHTWVLDKQRSQSMMPYLRLMGLSEMAIEAWTKAEKETDTFRVIDMAVVSPAER